MDRRTFLKRTGQTIAGIAAAPLAVAAAGPAKIPVAQEPDMYFGTRSVCNPGMIPLGSWQRSGTTLCMISPGATPADPLNIKIIQPEDFYK